MSIYTSHVWVSLITKIMSQRSSSYPQAGGPSYKIPLNGGPVHAGLGPNHILYKEKGVDWIHSGRYPLSQQPGFEMQHNWP